MPDNVIKFGKAKKAIARTAREKQAAANRVRFGQKKSQKDIKKALAEKLQKKLDGHKRSSHKTSSHESGAYDEPTE